MKAKITLEYKDKQYIIFDKNYSEFMWEEGNWGCDCNRCLFIQEQCDKSFPDMYCGDKIKLVSIEVEDGH